MIEHELPEDQRIVERAEKWAAGQVADESQLRVEVWDGTRKRWAVAFMATRGRGSRK